MIYCGDCLKIFSELEEGSVDMVLTDPPYGKTVLKYDNVIPFEPMWEELNRIVKPNGCIALFGAEPFSSYLRLSNIKNYRYDWIWDKGKGSNPFLSRIRPMPSYENICIFYRDTPKYNPQFNEGKPYKAPRTGGNRSNSIVGCVEDKDGFKQQDNTGYRHPLQILKFSIHCGSKVHPMQKPVGLLEYLIRTYTDEGETVLDFTMGSGSTGVACKNTRRNFIGIEENKRFFDIATDRIKKTPPPKPKDPPQAESKEYMLIG